MLNNSNHFSVQGTRSTAVFRFTGTTAQSDSSSAYMSGLRLVAFPDRPAGAGAKEVSRFSCILFLGVPGVFDYAGPGVGSRITPPAGVAFPLTEKGRRPVLSFRSSIAQPTDASVYASPAASRRPVQDSRSGWSRFSFPVGLFHPLQHAGLPRRTPSPCSPPVPLFPRGNRGTDGGKP